MARSRTMAMMMKFTHVKQSQIIANDVRLRSMGRFTKGQYSAKYRESIEKVSNIRKLSTLR